MLIELLTNLQEAKRALESATKPNKPEGKSKAELRRERNEKQAAQRAVKSGSGQNPAPTAPKPVVKTEITEPLKVQTSQAITDSTKNSVTGDNQSHRSRKKSPKRWKSRPRNEFAETGHR